MSKKRQGLRASIRANADRPAGLTAAAVPVSPPASLPPPRRGDRLDDRFGVGSQWFERVDDAVPLARAVELVRNGAAVVIDPCGCGGTCGYEWPDDDELAHLRVIGDTRWRRFLRRSVVEEWRSDTGRVLLLLNSVALSDL